MFSISEQHTPSRKQLRSFGLIVAAGFLVIGLWPVVFRQQSPRSWALAISLISGLVGLVVPTILRHFYRVWMLLGECLGWINSRIILGGLFYLMVTPMRLVLTVTGHDPMNRRFDPDAQTYRILRRARPSSHMTHQF